MKKIIIVNIVFIILTCLVIEKKLNNKNNSKLNTVNVLKEEKEERYMFISYLDYSKVLKHKTLDEQQNSIDKIIKNNKKDYTTIVLQVRSFSDSIYESSIFPTSSTIVDEEGNYNSLDILDYFIYKCHKNNLKLYAWINPYRVRNVSDTSTLTKTNPAYKWLNTNNIKVIEDKGIYYNPASNDVKELIISGIKEIIDNYKVDGLLYDDYFYPEKTIDEENYKEYKQNNGKMTIEQYHKDNINDLIKKTYKLIKGKNKSILFGVSPDGNIDNNYNNNYADVLRWCKEDNYIDFIMPQLYYGFQHETKPFKNTIQSWNSIITNNIKLIPILSLYKSGELDEYAKEGLNEWVEYSDILKRQIEYSRNISNYKGFGIFRYDFYFNYNNYNKNVEKEVKNLKSVL